MLGRLRSARGLARIPFNQSLVAQFRPFSTTFSTAAEEQNNYAGPSTAVPQPNAPRLPRSKVAAEEISNLLRPSDAAEGKPAGAKHSFSKPPPGARVVNISSLHNRGNFRLGGLRGNIIRNPDGTVSVQRSQRPDRRPAGKNGNNEGTFRSRGARSDRPRPRHKRREDKGHRTPGEKQNRSESSPYDHLTEDIDWYAPYTKSELQVLSERVPAAPERKSELFTPKLGVDELLEYAPAVATDSNIFGKAATIRQALKTIAGGPVDPGHLAHPGMMAAKYDYKGIMYFEKLQTKELLEKRTNINIKLGPDDRLKDVLVRRMVKGQHEAIPATPLTDIRQLTRNYHLKDRTWTNEAINKFETKINELLSRIQIRKMPPISK